MKRLRRVRRRGPKRLAAAMLLLAFVLLSAGTVRFYNERLQPLVEQAAAYTVTDAVLLKINELVEAQITAGTFDYAKLVTVEKNDKGEITALISNVAAENLIQTRITSGLIESITDNYISDLKIPVGNLFSGSLFYGRGPCIPIRLKAVTNVSAEVENTFSAAGINQTRHRICLNVSVSILVLIPGKEIVAPVRSTIVVAETVIVGKVPETYAKLGG